MRRSIWRGDERGAVAIVLAAVLSAVAASAAVAIDVGLAQVKKTELQRTADVAALAAAQALPDIGVARAGAVASAEANMPVEREGLVLADADIEFGVWDPEARTFTAAASNVNAVRVRTRRASANSNAHQMQFARVIGYDALDLSTEAIATIAGRQLELALVLDVSGSMKETLTTATQPSDDDGTAYALCKSGGDDDDDDDDDDNSYWTSGCSDDGWTAPVVAETKIAALRRVATDLVDAIETADPSGTSARIAVIPFSGRVNIARHGASWMSSIGNGTSTRLCTNHRSGASATNDDPPSVRLFPPFTRNSYSCPLPRARGLTSDKALVRSTIAELEARGTTNTDVGMVWGWRAISGRWQRLWNEADRPAAYDDQGVQKVVVIMTDGENTPHQTGDSYTTGEANDRLRQQCSDMKDLNIRIFTVTFDAPNSIENLYRQCATSPDDWFSPASIAELESAFANIGDRLANRIALVH